MEQKDKQLMIFLAGELRNEKNVRALMENDSFSYYAADAGYILADAFGVSLERLLGDFDSAPKPTDRELLLFPSEKDQTDSELALDLAIRDGYRNIWMIAPFGGRFDHTIANLSLLEQAKMRDVNLKLYDGENLVFIISEGRYTFSDRYRYISFFPWTGDAVISLNGFKYPLDRYELKMEKPIGISNEPSKAVTPEIQIHKGSVLCICIDD